jgi:hypothetical protein
MLAPFDKRYGEMSKLRQSLFTIILSKGQGAPFVHHRASPIAIEPVYCASKRKLENGDPDLFHEPQHLSGTHDAGLSVPTSAIVTPHCIAITPVLGP